LSRCGGVRRASIQKTHEGKRVDGGHSAELWGMKGTKNERKVLVDGNPAKAILIEQKK